MGVQGCRRVRQCVSKASRCVQSFQVYPKLPSMYPKFSGVSKCVQRFHLCPGVYRGVQNRSWVYGKVSQVNLDTALIKQVLSLQLLVWRSWIYASDRNNEYYQVKPPPPKKKICSHKWLRNRLHIMISRPYTLTNYEYWYLHGKWSFESV